MITLHQPPSAWGMPCVSPFCTKLEAYLRLTGVEYQVKPGSPRTAPKGKVPYIDDDGTLMGDSQFIIEYLKKKHGDPLDARLTPIQRATGHTLRRTLEDGLYWSLVYLRWLDAEGWNETAGVFRQIVPMPALVMPLIRGQIKKSLNGQGTLRHTPQEINAQACADLDALSALVEQGPFLFGEEPTSYDCTAFAFVNGVLRFPGDSPTKRHTQGLAPLVAYHERFWQRVFADWKPKRSLA